VTRPFPYVDRDSREWWDALARHELTVQQCGQCGVRRWPARAICGACSSFEWAWEPVSGSGTILSWIVTHHAFLPGFEAPYATVMVQLDEQTDIVLPGGLHGAYDDPRLHVGAKVTVGFLDIGTDEDGSSRSLLSWELVEG
jgi:uncharacterized protein